MATMTGSDSILSGKERFCLAPVDTNRKVSSPVSRWRLTVQGVVQGIGFRPFVYRLAQELGLAGWVRNTPAGVEIEIEGPRETLACFLQHLQREAPPLARIANVEVIETAPLESPSM